MRAARLTLSAVACLAALSAACATTADDDVAEAEGALGEGTVCTHPVALPNRPLADILRASGAQNELYAHDDPVIANATAWPTYDVTSASAKYDPGIVRARQDPEDARANLASRFGDCAPRVKQHLETRKPNVYVYFTGYAGPSQNNSLVDEGAILRWINQRDPKALVFSINWSCADSHDGFCKENAARLEVSSASPEYRYLTTTTRSLGTVTSLLVDQMIKKVRDNQEGYNTALSHSMQLAALLVDQLLVADDGGRLGDIRFVGYSMGAHAASQLLVQDFAGDGSGFHWTRRGQCDDGGDACTVAHLRKVKWALGLGLPGWSEAEQRYNEIDGQGVSRRDPAAFVQDRNGGLVRIADLRFNGKMKAFNRRMDPTANADDVCLRGFGDLLLADYNHYGHDYSMPLFVDGSFVRALDAFLESPDVRDNAEVGVVHDNAGRVDFDDCPASGPCEARTGYLAHAENRSHDRIGIPRTVPVPTTDGVRHPEKAAGRAVTFAAPGAEPIELRTFDQEDLRGGVELYYRPQFDPAARGTRGVFAYGGCAGSHDELMPQAYVEDGTLLFSATYEGVGYQASVRVGDAALAKGKWTHLAFTWDLPVVNMASRESPSLSSDIDRYGRALILATGLRRALPTTFQRQEGQGTLRIYANGALVAEAPLGSPQSRRDCLARAAVLGGETYDVNGERYPAFSPYAHYESDAVSAGPLGFGTMCKAYRVRNTKAVFGCAQSEGVNAEADMDDITLVWGPGRTRYENVDRRTGAPTIWPIGPSYDARPLVVR